MAEKRLSLADDPELRAQFRKPHFGFAKGLHEHGHTGRLMTEEEARSLEAAGLTPNDIISDCEKNSSPCLDLSFASLSVCPAQMLNLQHVTELNLQKNYLQALPDDFGKMAFLKKLILRDNRLTSMPPSLAICDELQGLDLGNNKLTDLPPEYEDLASLEELFLDYNAFDKIPDCVRTGMTEVKVLWIIENPNLTKIPETTQDWAGGRFTNNTSLEIALDNSAELETSWGKFSDHISNATGAKLKVKWNKIWPDTVMNNVHLGSIRTVQNPTIFESLQITHVLTCGKNLPTNSIPPSIKHLVLEVDDSDSEPLKDHFMKAIDFIKSAGQGGCLVHCFAGVSRSATIVIAYLMYSQKISFSKAMQIVREQRPAANPNPNFVAQLEAFGKQCCQ